jgi:hypothetical protein
VTAGLRTQAQSFFSNTTDDVEKRKRVEISQYLFRER